MNLVKLTQEWATVIVDCETIDPAGEHLWASLAYGWALGKGASPELAERFVTWTGYST